MVYAIMILEPHMIQFHGHPKIRLVLKLCPIPVSSIVSTKVYALIVFKKQKPTQDKRNQKPFAPSLSHLLCRKSMKKKQDQPRQAALNFHKISASGAVHWKLSHLRRLSNRDLSRWFSRRFQTSMLTLSMGIHSLSLTRFLESPVASIKWHRADAICQCLTGCSSSFDFSKCSILVLSIKKLCSSQTIWDQRLSSSYSVIQLVEACKPNSRCSLSR